MASFVIIGGGPAGLSAAVYAARANLDVTVYYKDDGALSKADLIENYFGFGKPISAVRLLQRGRQQARRLGAVIKKAEVTGLEFDGRQFSVHTPAGDHAADALLLATGAPRKSPSIPGLAEREGSGVSYCAVCDAFFYRGKSVAVLGQGQYAISEAQTLLPVAGDVTLLTNGLPAPSDLPDGLIVREEKIHEITGDGRVEGVSFEGGNTLPVSGLFIAYGTAGSTDFARKIGAIIKDGRIVVDESMQSNVPGLFAAGDCTGGLLQISKAVGDGAVAAMSAIRFLRDKISK